MWTLLSLIPVGGFEPPALLRSQKDNGERHSAMGNYQCLHRGNRRARIELTFQLHCLRVLTNGLPTGKAAYGGQSSHGRGFRGADLVVTLSEAGGVSHLYPGKHLAGTP